MIIGITGNYEKEKIYSFMEKYYLFDYIDVDEILKTLFKYGVLGNMKVQHNNGNNDIKYYFGYREDGSDIINFNEKFTVHFALRKALV